MKKNPYLEHPISSAGACQQGNRRMAERTRPTRVHALIPIVVLIALLSVNVILFGASSIDGANQLALLLAAAVAGIISFRLGYSWKEIEMHLVRSISSAMSAIIILLIIGA